MSETAYKKIGIIGSGAWGTALAITATRNASEVLVYTHDQTQRQAINQHTSHIFPEIALPKEIIGVASLAHLQQAELILLVVPAQAIRSLMLEMATISDTWPPFLICAKGIELNTNLLLSQIVDEVFPNHKVAVLAGPNFAREVAHNKITVSVVATKDKSLGYRIISTLSSREFRPSYSSDVTGLQLIGAAKNVYAIATGITEGMQLGENAQAAVIAASVAEVAQLCVMLGGDIATLMSWGGIGDIVLSCTSKTSRNMALGSRLGSGEALSNIISTNIVHEGYLTTRALYEIAYQLNLDTPILYAVHAILYKNMPLQEALDEILSRQCQ